MQNRVEIYDRNGSRIVERDSVRLLEIPSGLLDDLPQADREAITKLVGKEFVVLGFGDHGEVEVEHVYPEGHDYYSRTIWVAPSSVVKLAGDTM